MLALLFPTVILLSAVATLIGAGAHLITVSVLWETTGRHIGFTQWLLLGLPLAVASSHLAAELVLLTILAGTPARARARCRAWTPATASCPPRWSRPRPCCARASSSPTPPNVALRMIVMGTRLPVQAEVSGTQRPSSVR